MFLTEHSDTDVIITAVNWAIEHLKLRTLRTFQSHICDLTPQRVKGEVMPPSHLPIKKADKSRQDRHLLHRQAMKNFFTQYMYAPCHQRPCYLPSTRGARPPVLFVGIFQFSDISPSSGRVMEGHSNWMTRNPPPSELNAWNQIQSIPRPKKAPLVVL